MPSSVALTSSLLLAAVSSVYAQSAADLVGKLRLAPTAVDRLNLLADSDLAFDFFNPTAGITTGSAGHTVAAAAQNFPAVIGNGVAMTVGFLGPCGMNTPHTHPRATEINFIANGTLRTGLLSENGARFIMADHPTGTATVFPQGAIHFEQNIGCEPAMFVAAFNNEDPGVTQVAQRYFGLPPDVVGATLGGIGVQEVAGLEAKIPDNIAAGTDDCLQRCGLTRPATPPTAQRQPRNSANALPAGFSGPTAAAPPPAASTSAAAVPASSPLAAANSGKNVLDASTSASDKLAVLAPSSGTSPVLIALLVINALLVAVAVVGLVVFIRSRRQLQRPSYKYMATSGIIPKSELVYDQESSYYDPYRTTPIPSPAPGPPPSGPEAASRE